MGYGASGVTNLITNALVTVLNDGFEFVDRSNPKYTVGGYTTGEIISGWRVDANNVDVVHNGRGLVGPSHTGTNGVELNGTPSSARGSISTNVNTTVGKFYSLRFAYCRNPDNAAPASVRAQVELNAAVALSFTHNLPSTYANPMWLTTSIVFQATSPVTKVGFRQVAPAGGEYGMYIDSVRMDLLEIITNRFIYTTFTENTDLTITPIKFGTPPFTNDGFGVGGIVTTQQQVVYFADFDGAIGPEWSPSRVATSPTGVRFLGKFDNETLTLDLNTNFPPHNQIEVSFDLYAIDSWDGNPPWTAAGPDIWDWNGWGTNVLHTTFANFPGAP